MDASSADSRIRHRPRSPVVHTPPPSSFQQCHYGVDLFLEQLEHYWNHKKQQEARRSSHSSASMKSQDRSAAEAAWREKMDITKLALCWALTLTTSTLLTTIGPLAAKDIGASDTLAPFTIGTFLIGAAVSSVPSGKLFRKYGRYWGFTFGCFCQLAGSAVGSFAMIVDSLPLLFMGCFSVGLGQGLGQFYRFAAVEVASEDHKSKAVTFVLTGGVLAAFLGPSSANFTKDIVSHEYFGSFLSMAVIGLLNWGVVALVNFPPHDAARQMAEVEANSRRSRPLREIMTQPIFIMSCTVATIAHTVMVMIMSNCTIAMDEDYTFQTATIVLELHFFAMFSPGFYTGKFIKHSGTFVVSVYGAILFAMSATVFAIGQEKWNYFAGMLLLGIAWNFSFSAGTVMLTESYLPHEATDVQAANDFILFTIAGAGSLVSGVIYSSFSWPILIYSSSALMLVNLVLFSGIYYMKVKHPDNDFLSLKLNEQLIDEDDETALLENTDKYEVDERRSDVSANQYPANRRVNSMCSDNHMENMEKVRSLSFV